MNENFNRFLIMIEYSLFEIISVTLENFKRFLLFILISKGLVIHRQVKINDKTELGNGVMTTPKRCSVLSFIFTCLLFIERMNFG